MPIRSKIDNILRTAALVLTMAAAGCSADTGIDYTEPLPDGSVLRLTTGSSFTRAGAESAQTDPDGTPADLFAEGEEVISRVDLFFFSDEDSDEAAFYTYEVTDLKNSVTTADLTVKVPVELIEKFPLSSSDNKRHAYIYALVNLPAAVKVTEGKEGRITDKNNTSVPPTMENIRKVWVDEPLFVTAGVPPTFVMRGGETVDVEGENKLAHITGTIKLERLASKIRLWADIPDALYIDKTTNKTLPDVYGSNKWAEKDPNVEKWMPVLDDISDKDAIKLYLYNLATRGRIDGYTGTPEERASDLLGYDAVDRVERADAARVIVTGDELHLSPGDRTTYENYRYSHSVAYYSYPNVWDNASMSETHRTYVVLALPWQRMEHGTNESGGEYADHWSVYYYQIPVNALNDPDKEDADRLDPNRYYRIRLRVGMLGSKDLGTALPVDASWESVPWVSENVDVSIKPRRYLVVNQKVWVMNNVWTLEIPFSTSHPTEVEECYVTYFRYNDIWGRDKDTDNNPDEKHTSTEFANWLDVAAAPGNNVKETEGEITSKDALDWGDTGQTLKQMLYYKKDYFYDAIYADWGKTDDAGDYGAGFKYYIGHEHPKTFQKTLVGRPPKGLPQKGWDEFEEKYKMDSVYTCYIDNNKSVIRFNHPLVWWKEAFSGGEYYYVPEMKNNKLRDEYSRCEITIKLKHSDWDKNDDLYRETIHITQYPGLYIEVSHDYGSVVPASGRSGNEYVLVNTHTTEAATPTNWNEVSSYMRYFGYINFNPNMYVIHTTQLSEEYDGVYILGDPRSLYYNNQLGSNERGVNERLHDTSDVINPNGYWYWYNRILWPQIEYIQTAKRLYEADTNGNGILKYYYPADEADGEGLKESFVAPVFRVASSFGKVSLSVSWLQDQLGGANTLDIESGKEARRRCAIYQEAGRPAGRWRMPTISEIEYVMRLSVDGKIPHLFGLPNSADEHYWCSTGLISVNLTNLDDPDITVDKRITRKAWGSDIPQNRTPAVRCVYDEWYWTQIDGGKLPTPFGAVETDFYWGDRPKDNTQTQRLLQQTLNKKEVIALDE